MAARNATDAADATAGALVEIQLVLLKAAVGGGWLKSYAAARDVTDVADGGNNAADATAGAGAEDAAADAGAVAAADVAVENGAACDDCCCYCNMII